MKRRLPVSVGIASVAVGAVAAILVARCVWNRQTTRDVVRLHERIDAKAQPFSIDELDGLPDPVMRYFEFALPPGQSVVRNARFRQTGEFAMRANSWRPFTAVEYFSVAPPGFFRDAKIRMAGILSFFVRDGYGGGEGALYGTVAAIIPAVNQRGTPAMAAGELLRYLAEAVLFPTALLPRDGIAWAPIDRNNARVTLSDGATTVSCDVRFGERREIIRISAMRARAVNGGTELTPWVGHWRDFQRTNGMIIPMSGEVQWMLPDGPFSYWRGRSVDAHYEFAR